MDEQSGDGEAPRGDGNRVPVYAIWPVEVGPMLSLGMLTACARSWRDGVLNRQFEIRRPETAASFLDDLATRAGPAVLLCSNYVWSLAHNLEAAAAARALSEELIVVHGGPSTPKYEGDAATMLDDHASVADILVRGEGEETLCELLEALVESNGFGMDTSVLSAVEGITFRDPDTRTVVRAPDRARMADLDQLPSPYLTGEFDHLTPDAWYRTMSIETNRGCPYGCTFCDWGSATMSRIRRFSMERVAAEFEWAASHGIKTITITDANFGIMSRDVEIAECLADVFRRTGAPHGVSWTGAKNTTKHLVKIMSVLIEAGVTVNTSLSLQTTDPTTLEVLDRTNISTEHYVKLAADYRRRGFPIQGDLMLGLPAQTFETYKADLQFMLDHEIMVRSWPVQMLPNAPMNAPEYRSQHGIEVGSDSLITATNTFDQPGRRRMWRFRTVDTIAERMGLLRHVMRYLQWDHDIAATDLMEHLLDLTDHDPRRFPRVSWVFGYFDLFQVSAGGWSAFFRELKALLVEDFGLDESDSGLATVLAVQRALMPAPGRSFPLDVELDHDYVTYYRSATLELYTTGQARRPDRSLRDYPPATFTVPGDPLELCTVGVHPEGDARNELMQGDFHMGADVAYELTSPLMRMLPALSYHGIDLVPDWVDEIEEVHDGFADDDEDEGGDVASSVAVAIDRRSR